MGFDKTEERNKRILWAALVLALLLLCVAPMLTGLYTYNRTHVEVEREGIQYASVKNTLVKTNQRRAEYVALIEEQEQMKKLGITDE